MDLWVNTYIYGLGQILCNKARIFRGYEVGTLIKNGFNGVPVVRILFV